MPKTLRRSIIALAILALPLSGLSMAASAAPGDAPESLTVRGLAAPLDLDTNPTFGWHVQSSRQTAYEIVVSSSPQNAAAGEGDVWASGRVDSPEQSGIAYEGPALTPSERYFWTVRTWDQDDEVSARSEVGQLGTGPGSSWSDSEPIWAGTESENWTDYTIETDFTVVRNAASLTFRATSTSDFYLWQVRASDNTLRTHDGTTVIDDTPLADRGITIETGATHTLRVEVEGTTIRTWIDDVLVRESDDHTSHPSGGFGFRTGRTEEARFDDLSVTSSDGETLYANDFDSGEVPELGSLSVSDGRLVVGTSRNDLVAGSFANYSLRTTMTIDEVATGLQFRAADARNSYMWQLRGGDNRLVPHRQVDGSYSVLKTVDLPAGTLAVGKEVEVRIDAVGTTIRTWIDGTLVDTTEDPTFRRGTVGFRNGNSESATFDDLSVIEAGSGSTSGTTLLSTDFDAGDRTFGCGTVGSGTLRVGRGQVCLPSAATANWAFLRQDVDLPAGKEVAWASVFATGTSPEPAKQYVYKLYLNGEFVGLGPTQSIGSEVRYDGFDVTDQLESGAANALGAIAYTTSEQKFQAELVVEYTDGTRDVFGTGPNWTSLNGSDAMPAAGSIGTNFYAAPKENLDARVFPFGFDEPGFDDAGWQPARIRPAIGELAGTPTDKVEQQLHDPVEIVDKGNGTYFVDFGRSWVGGVQYDVEGESGQRVDLRFGETTSAPNTVRFAMNTGNNYQDIVTLDDGAQRIETWGLRVFRYLEIVDAPEPVTAENLKALALVYPFDRDTATFSSSNDNLNQVHELSKNSIEALNVNFYTDSWTRERINYEADGYLQQLSTLYLMEDLSLGRYSMDYFKANRTWPTEWPITVILAVHDAWRQTGDLEQVEDYFDNLTTKLPARWVDADTGLIRKTDRSNGCNSQTDCDIVDWPTSQRDGYQFRQYNTVVNAYAYRAMRNLAAMGEAIGRDEDAATYTAQADRLREAMNERLYDEDTGRYDDGMDATGTLTGHHSLHASSFALAFGVPEDDQAAKVAEYVDSRGMACSVYCAAFLVKGLYDGGNGQAALDALTDEGTSSWMNMIKLGAGATMEAWDPSQKPNLTYSHPWAASPAFTIPSGLFGIQPVTEGYGEFEVKPQPGDLDEAEISVPTVRGSIATSFEHDEDGRMRLGVTVPGNTEATVRVPLADDEQESFVPAHPQEATYEGRSELAGGTYATFTVGAGSWTFGPGDGVIDPGPTPTPTPTPGGDDDGSTPGGPDSDGTDDTDLDGTAPDGVEARDGDDDGGFLPGTGSPFGIALLVAAALALLTGLALTLRRRQRVD